MKHKDSLENRAAYAALIAGILCLIPYPYLPPIGSNTMLMYLWPVFAVIAVISGIAGLAAENRAPEKGGKFESWLGILSGTGLLLMLFLTSGIHYVLKDGYPPQFEFINRAAGNVFMSGPFIGGVMGIFAMIKSVKELKTGREKLTLLALMFAGVFAVIMGAWYGVILVDSAMNPKTLG